MSPSVFRLCAAPGCSTLVARGRCPEHRRAAEVARGTPNARGYDAAHQAMRKRVLREEPTCAGCGADGQPGDHADHIVPSSRGGTNERANYQRLCSSCNSRKSHEDAR